jgi:ribose/xylose/arabinose/galactoside ABC-type transport system permease subunit
VVVITGGIDLSVGSMIGLTSVIAAYLATHGVGPSGPFNLWLAALVGLVAAAGIGWIHGTLISRYKLAPLIVTFGSLILLRGIAKLISNASPINLNSNTFDWLYAKVFGIIPVPAFLMLGVFISVAYLLRNTRYGRYAYAIGNNETVARLSGVNVDRTRQIAYAVSGLMAGMGGLLVLALIRGGTYSNGQDYELFTIAAVIIGGTRLKGGSGGVWGTLGGVLLMSMINNGLVLFSVPPLWNETITGAIIIGAAMIDVQRRQMQESSPSAASFAPRSSPTAANTLDQAMYSLTRAVRDRFGYHAIRVYLLDRESDSLVEPRNQSHPVDMLARQAHEVGKALYVNDLRRERRFDIAPLHPEVRAAAAVPLMRQHRIIGVLELQSNSAGAFGDGALESVSKLGTQMAGDIEDNWLLEAGWLTRQVRENLRNLDDEIYLDKSPLAEWFAQGAGNRGAVLQQTLLDAIQHLHLENLEPASRAARRYQILRETYIDHKNVDTVIRDLGLSRRQYFYDLKEAVDAVTHHLFTQRRRTEFKTERKFYSPN